MKHFISCSLSTAQGQELLGFWGMLRLLSLLEELEQSQQL